MTKTLLAIGTIFALSGCMPPPDHIESDASRRVWTEEHRGHLYVFRGGMDGHFIHSPECQCGKAERKR